MMLQEFHSMHTQARIKYVTYKKAAVLRIGKVRKTAPHSRNLLPGRPPISVGQTIALQQVRVDGQWHLRAMIDPPVVSLPVRKMDWPALSDFFMVRVLKRAGSSSAALCLWTQNVQRCVMLRYPPVAHCDACR